MHFFCPQLLALGACTLILLYTTIWPMLSASIVLYIHKSLPVSGLPFGDDAFTCSPLIVQLFVRFGGNAALIKLWCTTAIL